VAKLYALKQLANLVRQDLTILAKQYGVTVVSPASNKFNKRWGYIFVIHVRNIRIQRIHLNTSRLRKKGVK
jgi:hypothetical protein